MLRLFGFQLGVTLADMVAAEVTTLKARFFLALFFWTSAASAAQTVYEFTGKVEVIRDDLGFFDGDIRPGQPIRGLVEIPSDLSETEGPVNQARIKSLDASMKIFLGHNRFESDPEKTDILVEVINNKENLGDALVIRSHRNVIKKPLSTREYVFEDTIFDLQWRDPSAEGLNTNSQIPANWARQLRLQPMTLNIMAGHNQRLSVIAKIDRFARFSEVQTGPLAWILTRVNRLIEKWFSDSPKENIATK